MDRGGNGCRSRSGQRNGTIDMKSLFSSMPPRRRHLVLLVIIYIGFISLGLPDTVLGVAWDSMRRELGSPVYCAGFLTTLLTICSAISAFFSGAILRRTGTGRLLMICGFVTGCSLLGYAFSPAFWCLLLFAVPLGFGQGAVDTGMNYFVARHYTSRDMSWLHCCWGIGASCGPGLVTLILAAGGSWRWGYVTVGSIQLCLALLFLLTLGLWCDPDGAEECRADFAGGGVRYSFRFWCCPAMMFLYCGIEFSMGLWGYQFLTGCRGFSAEAAGCAVAGYWAALTAGRFLVGCVANRLGNRRQIRFSMMLAFAGALLLLIPGPAALSFSAVGLVGFAFAPFYPAMMHAAPERFDETTAATVIGCQGGASMLGMATLPAAFGCLAAKTTFALLPVFAMGAAAAILLLQRVVDGGTRER